MEYFFWPWATVVVFFCGGQCKDMSAAHSPWDYSMLKGRTHAGLKAVVCVEPPEQQKT